MLTSGSFFIHFLIIFSGTFPFTLSFVLVFMDAASLCEAVATTIEMRFLQIENLYLSTHNQHNYLVSFE